MSDKKKTSPPIAALALILAWIVPGLGHIYLGKYLRGAVIFLAIGATFWAAVGMGGVMTVDYQNQRWWFAAQMLTGVHGIVGWERQRRVYEGLSQELGPPPEMTSSTRANWALRTDKALAREEIALVAPTSTIALAYAGVAGLLNIMCIFDATLLGLMGVRGEPRRRKPEEATE